MSAFAPALWVHRPGAFRGSRLLRQARALVREKGGRLRDWRLIVLSRELLCLEVAYRKEGRLHFAQVVVD